MVKEFVGFLRQYGVIGLAIAVIIGSKLGDFVKAIVDGILMPIVGAAIPGGDWRAYTFAAGPVKLQLGMVLGATIDFVIVAFVVFWIAKTILREETVAKK